MTYCLFDIIISMATKMSVQDPDPLDPCKYNFIVGFFATVFIYPNA